MSSSTSDRSLIARIAAHERWSRLDASGRAQATEAARRAADDRFLMAARVIHPDASEAEVRTAAANLRSAHAVRAARARWSKAGAS